MEYKSTNIISTLAKEKINFFIRKKEPYTISPYILSKQDVPINKKNINTIIERKKYKGKDMKLRSKFVRQFSGDILLPIVLTFGLVLFLKFMVVSILQIFN